MALLREEMPVIDFERRKNDLVKTFRTQHPMLAAASDSDLLAAASESSCGILSQLDKDVEYLKKELDIYEQYHGRPALERALPMSLLDMAVCDEPPDFYPKVILDDPSHFESRPRLNAWTCSNLNRATCIGLDIHYGNNWILTFSATSVISFGHFHCTISYSFNKFLASIFQIAKTKFLPFYLSHTVWEGIDIWLSPSGSGEYPPPKLKFKYSEPCDFETMLQWRQRLTPIFQTFERNQCITEYYNGFWILSDYIFVECMHDDNLDLSNLVLGIFGAYWKDTSALSAEGMTQTDNYQIGMVHFSQTAILLMQTKQADIYAIPMRQSDQRGNPKQVKKYIKDVHQACLETASVDVSSLPFVPIKTSYCSIFLYPPLPVRTMLMVLR